MVKATRAWESSVDNGRGILIRIPLKTGVHPLYTLASPPGRGFGKIMRLRGLLSFPTLAALCMAQTGLFEAARGGDLARLRSLVTDKKLVDLRDANGRTALHEAVANCHLEAAQILVDAGWSRTLPDNQNRTPLALASQCPRDIQAQYQVVLAPPVQEDAPWSLQYAAGRHQVSVISMLLNMRADANALGSD